MDKTCDFARECRDQILACLCMCGCAQTHDHEHVCAHFTVFMTNVHCIKKQVLGAA